MTTDFKLHSLCEFIIYCKLATGEYVQLLGRGEATRMVSSLVSGKVFAEELSDHLQRSAPPPLSWGLSAVAAAACNYNKGGTNAKSTSFLTSVMLSLLFAPPRPLVLHLAPA